MYNDEGTQAHLVLSANTKHCISTSCMHKCKSSLMFEISQKVVIKLQFKRKNTCYVKCDVQCFSIYMNSQSQKFTNEILQQQQPALDL